VKKQRILITGGTGSLGTALSLRLIRDNHIVVLSRNEERQYELEQKLKLISNNYTLVLGRVEDVNSLERAAENCTAVIHTAAMKDLIYAEMNPYECIHNNVIATHALLQVLRKNKSVKYLCGISTDKSVSPSNIYGASKLAMESMFMDFANKNSNVTTTVARFGNMIDSKGSLISSWLRNPELLRGITHPDCSRFFFKVDDAVAFVLETISESANGTISIPLMKKIFIKDLIMRINPTSINNILGLYPGEKLSEKLVADEELNYTHFGQKRLTVNRVIKKFSFEKISKEQLNSIDSATAESFTSTEIDSLISDLLAGIDS
jgi:UDP-N-acetylglucosamine 4,6-dehydratase